MALRRHEHNRTHLRHLSGPDAVDFDDVVVRGRRRQPGSSDADKGFRVVTPGEQFFQHGKQLYRDGKLDDARQTLEDLVKAFAKVGTETTWVNRAKDLLAEIKASQQNPHRWDPLFIALDQAEKLKRDGKSDEANEKVRSLQRLYQNQQIPELAASQIKRILEMNSKKD